MKQRWFFVLCSLLCIGAIVLIASGAANSAPRGLYRLVGTFGQAVSLVRSSYVEEVPVDTLEQGALTGLVESADPGGAFVPDAERADFARQLGRELPAYGLLLGKRSTYPIVIQVVAGSPADNAGIQPGELIESIDGKPVRARPLWRALVLLDGLERRHASAKVDVIDRQLRGKRPVELVAGPVAGQRAAVETSADVPVVKVPTVSAASARELEVGLRAVAAAPAVVVDLRGVGLGTFKGALDVAAVVAGGDCEVQLGQRAGAGDRLRAKGEARSWRIVVCVDVTTAGPAELLAAALKARGATLVGSETHGDTGQRRARKGAGGELWMAESWGVGPDGKPILGDGLKADEVVRGRRGVDLVLTRALELARGGQAKQPA